MSTTLIPRPTDRRAGPPGPLHRPPSETVAAERDPRWARPALALLLVATAVLYLWDLSASGWANSYYAAAVQAGSQSWSAWFFGALDAGGAITVDKPPAALWVMGLAARVFGFSSWSMLVPQALEGVAAVGLLYAAVKRWSGPAAGLLAGAALALTPAAALMFRFNNPDALLTLLLVGAAYGLVRALDTPRRALRWLAVAGGALGVAFLTKMLQGLLVVPGFALVYLLAADLPISRRIRHVLVAAASMIASAGWFVAIVELMPESARPYIGGSTGNSLIDLVIGYNGLGRLTGSGGSAAQNGVSFGSVSGWGRLFDADSATEVSWLLPSALVGLAAGLWLTRRAPRTDRTRAALLLWGSWLVATAAVFSFMQGTFHTYYTIALAPAIAGLVAVAGRAAWQRREALEGRLALAAMTAAAGGWSFVLLSRTGDWLPALRLVVLALTALATLGWLVPSSRLGRSVARPMAAAVLATSVVAGLAGPAAWTAATVTTAHQGSIVNAGPASASNAGMGGVGGAPSGGPGGTPPSGTTPSSTTMTGTTTTGTTTTGTTTTGMTGTTTARAAAGPGEASTSSELVALLQQAGTRWAAATSGAQSAASLELASGTSVIGIGGFTGDDPAPTLAQFQQYVSSGQVRYFVVSAGGGGGGGGQSGSASAILTWVQAHSKATTVGSTTVYDLG